MDAEEFKQLKNNIYERETDFNFTTEGDGFALFKSNNVNHEHCRLHKKNEHYMATDVMKAHYGLHNVFLSHAEVLSQKCDAFLKISGEHFPKCMWKWYGHSELNCYNFPQYKDPVTITFAVNVGWKTTYGQQKSHSTSDTKHGSQTESEETNWGINGKLAPAAKGFSIWSLGAEYSKKNAYTNTTGWNKETTDSFLEMKGDETSGFYTVTRSITCHPGQHTQVLQKIFLCGDEQLRSGLFVNWDHSWTKETLSRLLLAVLFDPIAVWCLDYWLCNFKIKLCAGYCFV
uniref:Uncharacterized protein n=1 Tax=Ditylenchus dipsaci TaxID=166011 RepID=A0A915CYV0_9BILA